MRPALKEIFRRVRRRHWLSILAGAVVAALLVCYALRGVLLSERLSAALSDVLASETQMTATVGPITGSYLGGIDIANIHLQAKTADAPLQQVSTGAVSVRYSLFTLLQGTAAFIRRTSVSVSTPRVVVKLDSAGEPTGEAAEPLAALAMLRQLPPLPSLRLTGFTLAMQGTGSFISLGPAGIRLHENEGRVRLDVDIAGGDWKLNADAGSLPSVSFTLTAADHGLRLGPATVGDELLTADAQVDLSPIPGAVPFTVNGRLGGAPVSADGTYGQNRVAVAFKAKGVDVGAVIQRTGLKPPESVSGILDVDGQCDIPLDAPQRMVGTLALAVADAGYGKLRLSRAEISVHSDGQSLRVVRAELAVPKNRLTVDGLRLPLAQLLDADTKALAVTAEGRFELEGADAAALLQRVSVDGPPAGELPPHDYRLSGALSNGTLAISEGRLTAGGGALLILPSTVTLPRPLEQTDTAGLDIRASVDFPDVLPLSRILSLPLPLSGIVSAKMAVTGTLGFPEGRLTVNTGPLRLDGRDVGALNLSTSAAAGALHIETLDWRNGDDRISAKGDVHVEDRRANAVAISFSVTDPLSYIPAPLVAQVPAAVTRLKLNGTAHGKVGIDGPLSAPRISLDARLSHLRTGPQPLGSLAVKGSFDAGRIHIDDALLVNGKDRVRFEGSFDTANSRLEAVQAEVTMVDVAPYLSLLAETPPQVQGDLKATLSASGDIRSPEAHLSAASTRLETTAGALTALTVAAEATSERRLRITELAATLSDTRLAAAGTLQWNAAMDAATFQLSALSLDRNSIDLRLTAPAVLEANADGRLSVTPLTLSGAAGTVTLDGRLDPIGPVALQAKIVNLNGQGWLPDLTGNRLDVAGLNATLTVSGTRDTPRIAIAASADTVRSPLLPVPMTGRMDLHYADARLYIRHFDWSHTDGSLIRISGDIPFQFEWQAIAPVAPVALTADIDLPQAEVLNVLFGKRLIKGGRLSAEVLVAGTWDNPEGSARMDGDDLVLENGALPLPPGPLVFSAKARYRERAILVERCRLSAPSVTVIGQGSWKDLPPPWLASQTGDNGAGGAISMDATVSAERLDWAAKGLPGIRAVDGRLAAEVHLRGSLKQPDITAAMSIEDGHVRAEGRLPALEAITVKADISQGNLTLSHFGALIGAAPLSATGHVNAVMSSEPSIDLRLTGDNLLLYRDPGLRVRGNTALLLSGPLSRLRLTGDIAVTDGLFSQHIDYLGSLRSNDRPKSGERGIRLFSIRQAPLNAMRLDVGVSAVNPFVVRSNLIRGTLKPGLRLTGTAETPLLVGKVLVTSAQLRLPAGRMTVENGLIQFLNADPERPVLDLMGTGKLFGYDVRLLAEGPYDEPTITLSATPPLASEDILLMLLTGMPPSTDATAGDVRRRSLNVTMFIGQDLISKWFDSGEGDSGESVLERFDVQLGREVTHAGEETVEVQFKLADNVFRQGDTLYLTGEKDVYDYYNMGVQFVFRLR